MFPIVLLLVLPLAPPSVALDSYNILALLPHFGKSHFDTFSPLLRELAKRGHSVTVVSFFPDPHPPPGYQDVSLEGLAPTMIASLPVSSVSGLNAITDFMSISSIGLDSCEVVLKSAQLKNIIATNDTYDVILTEQFTTDCFLSVVDRLKAPFIGLSTSALFPTTDSRLGFLDHAGFTPNMFLSYSDSMSYTERVSNTLATLIMRLLRSYYYEPAAFNIARKHLGRGLRALSTVAEETSLVLVNTHFTTNRPKMYPPNVVEIGGLHIKAAQPLPKDIAKFLDGAKQGAIFISFGSMLNSTTLPKEKKNAFLHMFEHLTEYSFIWKYDGDDIKSKDNLMVSSWLPQRDILGHKNIRLFITHGGLLGTAEAVFSGVPMLGIPMYGDQGSNMAALQENGVASVLAYRYVNNRTLLSSVSKVLQTPKYEETSDKLSLAFRDRPIPPLDLAVFWTEYVARHGGSPYTKPASSQLHWTQYCMIDVAITLAICSGLLAMAVRRALDNAANQSSKK